FSRYIQGHDVAEYARLLARAGFAVRQAEAGHAWLGDVRFDNRNGVHIAGLVSPRWPIYPAGLEQDDEVQQIDGQAIKSDGDVGPVLARHKPGDTVPIVFVDRTGVAKSASITLQENPHLEVVPVASPTSAQQAFRDRWLKPRS